MEHVFFFLPETLDLRNMVWMRHGTNSAVFLYIVQKASATPHSDVDAKIRDPFIKHILELHNKYAVSFHCGCFVS